MDIVFELELEGIEHDWLAVDSRDCVALFTSAGSGYVPRGFVDCAQLQQDAIEWILAGSVSAECHFAPVTKAGFENTWRDAAERGLFAYDWDRSRGRYQIVAMPMHPHVSAIRSVNLPLSPTQLESVRRFVFDSAFVDNLLIGI